MPFALTRALGRPRHLREALADTITRSVVAVLTAQPEKYVDCLAELQALYPQHYDELARNREHVRLNMNYAAYEALNNMGILVLVTLRDDKVLAGYFIGFLFPEMHCKDVVSCFGDFFWVAPEYRNKEWAGVALLRETEAELHRRKAGMLPDTQMRWYVGVKADHPCEPLFKRLGFTADEIHYSKMVA